MARRTFVRSTRRVTQWAGFGNTAGAASLPIMVDIGASASAIISQGIIASGAAGLVAERFTLTRTIGRLTVALNANTANVNASVAVGCIKVRSEAAAAGTGSMPDLVADPDADWVYYTSVIMRNPNNTLRDGATSMIHIPFDVKSQRKLDGGEQLVWIGFAITNNVSIGVTGRYLLKLV